MQRTFSFQVSGRVQGVSFRMATKQQADLHGLSGWVRNRPDGDVEGVVTGDEAVLEEFRNWLQRGPTLAKVLKLDWQEVPLEEFNGFEIR
ncbi:MAG: acylphosphatase [Gammaproteobacteria bacterium]